MMALAFGAMCSAAFAGTAPDGLTNDRNARYMTYAAEWLEGEFDNDLQVWFEADTRSQTPLDVRHQRIHTVHSRLPDAVLGTPALLVREYQDDDRTRLLGEHVVSLRSLAPKDGIRLTYYRLRGGVRASEELTSSMLEEAPGCDVILQLRGGQLEGSTQGSACAWDGAGGNSMHETLWLGPEVYWRHRTQVSRRTGQPVSRTEALPPTAFYKARKFDCSAHMFADSYLNPSPADKVYAFPNRHDLGDQMVLESPRDGKRYHLQLRRQRYPYYRTGGEFLLLRLREVGAPSSVAIVTSDSSNDNLSLNLGWAMIACNAAKP